MNVSFSFILYFFGNNFFFLKMKSALDSYALIFQIGSRNLHPPIPSDCPKQLAQLMEVSFFFF